MLKSKSEFVSRFMSRPPVKTRFSQIWWPWRDLNSGLLDVLLIHRRCWVFVNLGIMFWEWHSATITLHFSTIYVKKNWAVIIFLCLVWLLCGDGHLDQKQVVFRRPLQKRSETSMRFSWLKMLISRIQSSNQLFLIDSLKSVSWYILLTVQTDRSKTVSPHVELQNWVVFPGFDVLTFSPRFLHIGHMLWVMGSLRETPQTPLSVWYFISVKLLWLSPIWISHSPLSHRLTEALLMQLCNRLNIDEHCSDSVPKGIQASSQEKSVFMAQNDAGCVRE